MLDGDKSVQARYTSGWLPTQDVDPSVDEVDLARHDVDAPVQRLVVLVTEHDAHGADEQQECEEDVESFHVISSCELNIGVL